MFDGLDAASPDPILGLTEAFKKDPNPHRINLGVGEYKDALGHTPILRTVKKAEARLLENEQTKIYLPIDGLAEYNRHVQTLVFGASHGVLADRRAVTAQTPGGTAALRVAADLIAGLRTAGKVWLSDPTWPNHTGVFSSAGIEIGTYPYYDTERKTIAFEKMMETLETIPRGDVVLFHGGCHNPTGVDPDPNQWKAIAASAQTRGWIPLIDFAYQGFAEGIEADAHGLRTLTAAVPEAVVCSSFSKNFGLYNERVGALTLIAASENDAQKALGHMKRCIRTHYSSPPAHGASIVATILDDMALRNEWDDEVKEMRDRINGMRSLFVDTLRRKGVSRDFSFIARQRGMFSFSGLTGEQVKTLREKYSIYIVGNGRINVAGMTESNMDRLCQAITDVL